MIISEYQIRVRYGETDQMGYVYHANYVGYCHQARTEMLRELGVCDKYLEENNVMLPVIEMNLKYISPGFYDNLLTIKTIIRELPKTRFSFEFEFFNEENKRLCVCSSTVVFVDSKTRKPMRIPSFVKEKLASYFESN